MNAVLTGACCLRTSVLRCLRCEWTILWRCTDGEASIKGSVWGRSGRRSYTFASYLCGARADPRTERRLGDSRRVELIWMLNKSTTCWKNQYIREVSSCAEA